MSNPEDLLYTPQHEWVRVEGTTLTVGITAYAAEQLGEIVFAELPEVDAEVTAGTVVAEIESTKSVGEVYAPIDGTVTEINEDIADNPELINDAPFGEGWLFRIRAADPEAADDLLNPDAGALLDVDAYTKLTEQ